MACLIVFCGELMAQVDGYRFPAFVLHFSTDTVGDQAFSHLAAPLQGDRDAKFLQMLDRFAIDIAFDDPCPIMGSQIPC